MWGYVKANRSTRPAPEGDDASNEKLAFEDGIRCKIQMRALSYSSPFLDETELSIPAGLGASTASALSKMSALVSRSQTA